MNTGNSNREEKFPRALLRSAGLVIAILVSLVLILYVAMAALAPPRAHARLCNATGVELSQVNFAGREFGGLGVGAVTSPVAFEGLFADESVVVTMEGRRVKHILFDHVGDEPLASGTYTFHLISDGQSRIYARLDATGKCPQRAN
ncbi:MAG: hypothetical protein V4857_03360 [Pseudomonadota bacterium]